MATGEETDDESLGGAAMHATRSGLADFVAEDERDALRLARDCRPRIGSGSRDHRPAPGRPAAAGSTPTTCSASRAPTCGCRSTRARCWPGSLDGSEFDEFKPAYGTALVTGWGAIHGYPIGVLANARGVLFSAEAQKAAQFIQLANAAGTPLLFLQNTTGYMVGTEYEQGGIIKHGALMINAVANSTVPHLTVNIGASYGAGNYGMCGRAYEPRFLFTWPNAKSAVMGPQQLAGVLSIVSRQAAAAKGQPYDEEQDAPMRRMVEHQIEQQSAALFHVRPALRRRRHRPPRHPYRARPVPVARVPADPSTPRRRLRRLPDVRAGHDPQAAGGQPRRDRPPGLRHLPGAWASRRSPSTPTRTPTPPHVGRGRRGRAPAGQRAGRHLPARSTC